MFAIFFIVLTAAAAFGVVVFAGACALSAVPKLRPWGVAVGAGGFFGALAAFCLFAFFATVVEGGREPIFSEVALVFSAAGFGVGGVFGAALFGFARAVKLARSWPGVAP
jgi:hypothetical protein